MNSKISLSIIIVTLTLLIQILFNISLLPIATVESIDDYDINELESILQSTTDLEIQKIANIDSNVNTNWTGNFESNPTTNGCNIKFCCCTIGIISITPINITIWNNKYLYINSKMIGLCPFNITILPLPLSIIPWTNSYIYSRTLLGNYYNSTLELSFNGETIQNHWIINQKQYCSEILVRIK